MKGSRGPRTLSPHQVLAFSKQERGEEGKVIIFIGCLQEFNGFIPVVGSSKQSTEGRVTS